MQILLILVFVLVLGKGASILYEYWCLPGSSGFWALFSFSVFGSRYEWYVYIMVHSKNQKPSFGSSRVEILRD